MKRLLSEKEEWRQRCDEAAAEIERLRASLRGATDMIERLGVPLSYSGQAELDGYRRALEAKAERPGPPYDAAYEQNKRRR